MLLHIVETTTKTPEWISAIATASAALFAVLAFYLSWRSHREAREKYQQFRREQSPHFSIPGIRAMDTISLKNEGIIESTVGPVVTNYPDALCRAFGIAHAVSNGTLPICFVLQNDYPAIQVIGWEVKIPGTLTNILESPQMLAIDSYRAHGTKHGCVASWILVVPRIWIGREGFNIEIRFETAKGYVDCHTYRVIFTGNVPQWGTALMKRIAPSHVPDPDRMPGSLDRLRKLIKQ